MKVTCFLPCRKGSERVPRKNIKPFADHAFGLVEIKLRQLLAVERISSILLSTDDEEIIEFALALGRNDKILVSERPAELAASSTSTDELIAYVPELIQEGHVMWTHVTSPFINADDYSAIIDKYFGAMDEGYDSLMTTTPFYGFLWSEAGPINYDRNVERWPRTQTLQALHQINSGAFLASVDVYTNVGDRIGERPCLYEMDKLKGFDIDCQDDFFIGDILARSGKVQL